MTDAEIRIPDFSAERCFQGATIESALLERADERIAELRDGILVCCERQDEVERTFILDNITDPGVIRGKNETERKAHLAQLLADDETWSQSQEELYTLRRDLVHAESKQRAGERRFRIYTAALRALGRS